MAGGNGGAAATVGNFLLEDYQQNGSESWYCRYLELVDDGPGGWNPATAFARQRFCDPPPPPTPPTTDFFDAGGVPCRLYRVTFASGTPGQTLSPAIADIRGPVGVISETGTTAQGAPTKKFLLTGGTGGACPRQAIVMASSDNTNVIDVTARVISIVPLEGDPGTEVPVFRPPLQPPNPPFPPFSFELEFDIEGVEVNAPIQFGPIINTPFGPTIQFNFSPTANFNPQIDIDIGLNPSFGLDLNLEFVIPFGGTRTNPTPIPNAPPVPLPPVSPPGAPPCEEFDYVRIEEYIDGASCCKPIVETDFIGSFVFEFTDSVYTASVPDNAEYVVINIVPDNNSRRYKLAGEQSEIALGNASITSGNNSLGYEKIFVRRHVLKIPPNLPSPGIRVSLKQGCQIFVEALLHGI